MIRIILIPVRLKLSMIWKKMEVITSTFVYWPVLWTVEQFHIFTSVTLASALPLSLLACATCGTYKPCHALERNGSLWGIKGIFVKGDYF